MSDENSSSSPNKKQKCEVNELPNSLDEDTNDYAPKRTYFSDSFIKITINQTSSNNVSSLTCDTLNSRAEFILSKHLIEIHSQPLNILINSSSYKESTSGIILNCKIDSFQLIYSMLYNLAIAKELVTDETIDEIANFANQWEIKAISDVCDVYVENKVQRLSYELLSKKSENEKKINEYFVLSSKYNLEKSIVMCIDIITRHNLKIHDQYSCHISSINLVRLYHCVNKLYMNMNTLFMEANKKLRSVQKKIDTVKEGYDHYDENEDVNAELKEFISDIEDII